MSRLKDTALTRRAVIGAATAAAVAASDPAQAAAADATGSVLLQRLIDTTAARFEADLVALRRDLHAHPEAAGEETRTGARVAEILTAAGLTVTTGVGGNGVIGILKGRLPGRTVAYRADMDAVPAQDQIGGGVDTAHLCGHDLHTAIGVGVAQILARLRHRLSGTVVFVFQPAEENLTGARAMLADGVLNTGPEEIHALHCAAMPVGTFGINPGVGLPGQDRGTIVLTGPGASERAARLAGDVKGLSTVPLPAGSEDLEALTEALQTEDGPLARFITAQAWVESETADGAEVGLAYRCWPEERYIEIREDIAALAAAHGEAVVDFPTDPFPAMIGPETEAHELKRHLRRAMGPDSAVVLHASVPFNGEDFALFLQQIPGTYTYLGVRAPDADIATSFPHFGTFEPDESAIGIGVRAMSGWLAERTRC
ncbi:M20 metallopeptidase family protein [Glycomyces algeriensis]|uniref:N-acyl-L-amino acid amidohydrolase n=1 Tax=Glycomyces algeriensis TaxID=256037 RepID=A0A9W6LHY2_9ACTN|nr:amidohydrolase [Glycomyces algeriensis]MDA1365649.1 amidohydrolase [Glycomyces algeriensis]MDR7351337.1 amidohydrolase [Glycomyces algeriensis]GLI44053.1 N-acyl-L-amino acid amidohydrolase [Glycomyces algeriensis]